MAASSGLLLLLGSNIVAVGLLDTIKAFVFLPAFLDETAGDKVLQLLVSAEPEHFFAAAHRISLLQPIINQLKKVVKAEELVVISEHIHQFVSDVIREPT